MSRAAKKSSLIFTLVTLLVALVLIAIVSYPSHRSTALARDGQPTAPTAVDPTLLRSTLARLGLSTENLAAAGVDASSVSSIVQAVADSLRGSPTALSDADAAYATALTAVQSQETAIRAGQRSEQALSALASARTTLSSATAARAAVLSSMTASAVASLDQEHRSRLATITANRAACPGKASASFCAASRTPAQWAALRHALAAERLANAKNVDLDPANADILGAARADPAVSTATTDSANHATAINSAINSAVEGQH